MAEQEQNTQLVKFEKSLDVLKDTGLIYSQNKDSYTKAITAATNLINLAQKQPMSNDVFIDSESLVYNKEIVAK